MTKGSSMTTGPAGNKTGAAGNRTVGTHGSSIPTAKPAGNFEGGSFAGFRPSAHEPSIHDYS